LGAGSGADLEGGGGRGVLRRAARTRSPREARAPALQALRPGCEELAVTDPEAMPAVAKAMAGLLEARRSVSEGGGRGEKRGPGAQKPRGGAPRGERPAPWPNATGRGVVAPEAAVHNPLAGLTI